MLQIAPQVFFHTPVTARTQYLHALRGVLAAGKALAVIVEDDAAQPLAFGMSCFLSDEARQTILRGTHHIGYHLLRGQTRGILSPKDITGAHKGGGLNLLGFYGWSNHLDAAQLQAVRELLLKSFRHLHWGYHLKSFLKEVYGEEEAELYRRMGCEIYRRPEDYQHQSYRKLRPFLVGITRKQVCFPDRIADLFTVGRPSFILPRSLRQVAQFHFVMGLSARHAAQCCGVEPATIHVSWNRIYNCVRTRVSDTLEPEAVLRYLHENPAALYPLEIPRFFYRRPDRARAYPILVRRPSVAPPASADEIPRPS
ncbi:MAG: hypothetical protein WHS44_02430 [Fimbriimonadales bacterium]|nr:MAG: hypothetical protein KatS3mg018_2050 [Fimbriimonadales bacterium]